MRFDLVRDPHGLACENGAPGDDCDDLRHTDLRRAMLICCSMPEAGLALVILKFVNQDSTACTIWPFSERGAGSAHPTIKDRAPLPRSAGSPCRPASRTQTDQGVLPFWRQNSSAHARRHHHIGPDFFPCRRFNAAFVAVVCALYALDRMGESPRSLQNPTELSDLSAATRICPSTRLTVQQAETRYNANVETFETSRCCSADSFRVNNPSLPLINLLVELFLQ